jgi:NAD dependent epimerase/dehydratase family enzyme
LYPLVDEVGAIRFLMATAEARGAYNLAAPQPVRNIDLARALGRAMRRPAFFRVPAFLLRLLLGEKATLVLDGQRLVPSRLLEAGYVFRFPSIDGALSDLLRGQGSSSP